MFKMHPQFICLICLPYFGLKNPESFNFIIFSLQAEEKVYRDNMTILKQLSAAQYVKPDKK